MTEQAAEQGPRDAAAAEGRPTLTDVSRAYRLLFGREVESVAVAGGQIAASPTLWALIERLYGSAEAQRRRIAEAGAATAALDGRAAVSLDCTPQQLARMIDLVELDWARRGVGAQHKWLERELPRFDGRAARWTVDLRFEIGGREAEALKALCAATGATLPDAPSVAVFGPDAYRLAEAFPAAYVGVEPRPDDLAAGRAGLEARGLATAELVTVAQFRRRELAYDLFYSVMALQYAPPPMAFALLKRGLAQVRPGGLAFVQFAGHIYNYGFDAGAYLAGAGRDVHGEIHALPQHQVLALLDALGFAPVEVKPDGRLGGAGLSYTLLARRRA